MGRLTTFLFSILTPTVVPVYEQVEQVQLQIAMMPW